MCTCCDATDRLATWSIPACCGPVARWAIRVLLLAGWLSPALVHAQLDFESAPINYDSAAVDDPVQRLMRRLASGESKLQFDDQHGYLASLLEELNIPESSQMLVFSKTSFQLRKITPRRPRAVYFSDDVYIGWVQEGDVIEISAADPNQGAIFYTLEQTRADVPQIRRDRGQCIVCHASSRTAGVPGHLVRSVYASRSGQPYFGSGTFTTDHSSPFSERWGGWYVTGTHGKQRHMGNVLANDRDDPEALDREQGANLTDLQALVDVAPYLQPTSDLVALMVLEHQTKMHNLITRANFETRSALHYDQIMNEAMDRPADYRSESAIRRIHGAAEKLLEYLLFVGEYKLTDAVAGCSEFAAEFSELGPRDEQGRSLRDLDLSSRIMKYPCSYLIYSEPFDALPAIVKHRVYDRLGEVLSGADDDLRFRHLTASDRRAIREILQDTKPDLAAYWRDAT